MAEPAAPPEGWAALEPVPATAPDPELALAVARCFATADGARLLAHLRALTLDGALGPSASDAALRHREGQRALVLHLLALAARGRGAG